MCNLISQEVWDWSYFCKKSYSTKTDGGGRNFPPQRGIGLILFAYFLISVLCFSLKLSLFLALSIWEAIPERSHEPIYKNHTKIEAKRLGATTFAIAKLEER